MANRRVPRVFISYSHDSARHQKRVVDLADRLRADGIDAEIDQYNASPRERAGRCGAGGRSRPPTSC